jgi:hypothetical protein
MAASGVTPQAQNPGSSPGSIGTASPKSGLSRSEIVDAPDFRGHSLGNTKIFPKGVPGHAAAKQS